MKKMFISRCILFAILALTSVSFAGTVDKDRPVLTTVKIDRPLQMTGKLDDPLWLKAVPVYLTYEIQPGDNVPAPQRTEALVLHDQENLYIGFRCFDTKPDEIRANRSDRDKIFQDDFVLVILDTYGDSQKAYELAVNPFGVQGDLMMTMNAEDSGFDLVWQAAAARSDTGWTAELIIPFKSLRFSNKEIQEWSVSLIRNLPRSSRHQLSWTVYDRSIPSFLTQMGRLQGLQGVRSSGSLEILPYVLGQQVGSLSDWENPSAGLANDPVKGRVGGGIAYSPGPAISFDAVINPDFSQIETDADQISINTTFALNYPEKRPFFLIGQDLLQTPMYYSRSINNPLAAGRIIGKVGSLSYMVLSAWDRNTTFVIPGEEGSNTVMSDRESMANIGRFRYDFGNETYVGAMAMGRSISDGHNYLVGLDWNYKFLKNWYFQGETFLSHTKELSDTLLFGSERMFGNTGHDASLNGEQYAGTGLHAVLIHSDRLYHFNVVYNDFSPTYQTYNGLFPSVDYRYLGVHNGFTVYPKNTFIDQASLCITGSMQYNHDGVKKEQAIQPNLSLTMKGQTNMSLSYLVVNDESFHGTWFSGIHRGSLYVTTRPVKAFSLAIQASLGKFIYRTDVPEMGYGHDLWAEVQFRPTSKFSISFDYSRAGLRSQATDGLLYDGNIYRSVWLYQFTNEVFIRTIVQYNTFDKSFNLYPLFSYKLNVFTTFYAGMTNDWLDFGMPTGYRTTGRQFFIKMQYLFRT